MNKCFNGLLSAYRSILLCLYAALFSLFLPGCSSLVYKTTGDVMVSYSEKKVIPYSLSMDDVEMICSLGQSFSPFIFSFETVTDSPTKLKILMYMLSATCAEARAVEDELRYMRAIKAALAGEAQDARISQKRYLALAARRQYLAYSKMVEAFGEPDQGCPKLSQDEELYWMMGLLSGVLALSNDMAAENQVGVPLSIGARIAKGSECLSDSKWWGAPMALRAAVWIYTPALRPAGVDPQEMLARASQIGMDQRVRISQVIEAQVYYSRGDYKKVKQVIRKHAENKVSNGSNSTLKLIDEMATVGLLAISDRLWTDSQGSRTPMGGFGTFWDDKKIESTSSVEIDDLL